MPRFVSVTFFRRLFALNFEPSRDHAEQSSLPTHSYFLFLSITHTPAWFLWFSGERRAEPVRGGVTATSTSSPSLSPVMNSRWSPTFTQLAGRRVSCFVGPRLWRRCSSNSRLTTPHQNRVPEVTHAPLMSHPPFFCRRVKLHITSMFLRRTPLCCSLPKTNKN